MTHPLLPLLFSLAVGTSSFAILSAKYISVAHSASQVTQAAHVHSLPLAGSTIDKPKTITRKNTPTYTTPITSNSLPTISAIPDFVLQLGGDQRIIPFTVMDHETDAAKLKTTATSSTDWIDVKIEGTGTNRNLIIASHWISGISEVTITVEDVSGMKTSTQTSITTGSRRLPKGTDWTHDNDKILVLIAAFKMNERELKLFHEMETLAQNQRTRLLGGDIFVAGMTKVWKLSNWCSAPKRDIYEDSDPDEAFANTFRTVATDLAVIRGRRSDKLFRAFIPWHSLTSPQKIHTDITIKEARLLWTGENPVKQLKNDPVYAIFNGRVNGLGNDLRELPRSVAELFK